MLFRSQTPTSHDTALELARKAMDSIETTSVDCARKYEELSVKYESLEERYFKQIEINTAQNEQMVKLRVELLYFKTQLNPSSMDAGDPVDAEDHDPGY